MNRYAMIFLVSACMIACGQAPGDAGTAVHIGEAVSLESPTGGKLRALPPEFKDQNPVVERRVQPTEPPYRGCPTGTEFIAAPDGAEKEADVLRLVNAERERLGLNPVERDPRLELAARFHAADMATDDYFSHDSQDRSGDSLSTSCGTFDRIRKFAPNGFSENIAAGSSTAEGVMQQWMNSPGHKANILRENAKYLGVGYFAHGESRYGHYWVQNFGG